MKKIDLKTLFQNSVCTFEVAKKAKEAGMNCSNTFFAYDADGNITDGAWLEEITGAQNLFPAINVAFALMLLEETTLDKDKISLYEQGGEYTLDCDGDKIYSLNLSNVLVLGWIKYKKNETGIVGS